MLATRDACDIISFSHFLPHQARRPGVPAPAPRLGDHARAGWGGLPHPRQPPRSGSIDSAACLASMTKARRRRPCLLQELLPEKRYLYYPGLTKAVGSAPLAARLRQLRPDIHLFGHVSHLLGHLGACARVRGREGGGGRAWRGLNSLPADNTPFRPAPAPLVSAAALLCTPTPQPPSTHPPCTTSTPPTPQPTQSPSPAVPVDTLCLGCPAGRHALHPGAAVLAARAPAPPVHCGLWQQHGGCQGGPGGGALAAAGGLPRAGAGGGHGGPPSRGGG